MDNFTQKMSNRTVRIKSKLITIANLFEKFEIVFETIILFFRKDDFSFCRLTLSAHDRPALTILSMADKFITFYDLTGSAS